MAHETRYPAVKINWRRVQSTSGVDMVGWDNRGNMYISFKNSGTYVYQGVTRQRAVAMTRARSVGRYLEKVIKPRFEAIKIH